MESSDIPDANKINLRDSDEENCSNQKQSQKVPNKPPSQGEMKQNEVNNSKSNSNSDPATYGTLYCDGKMVYKGESRDETPSKTEHLKNEHDETGKNEINSGFGQNNLAGQMKIKSKDSQASGDKQTTTFYQSQNVHQEKNNPTKGRSVFDRLANKNEESVNHRQSDPRKNKRHSGVQNVSYAGLDKLVNSLYLQQINFSILHFIKKLSIKKMKV